MIRGDLEAKINTKPIFAVFLVVLESIWLYLEFEDRYSKKRHQWAAFLSAYDSTAQDLAAKFHQK